MSEIEHVFGEEAARWVLEAFGAPSEEAVKRLAPVAILAKRGGVPLLGNTFARINATTRDGVIRADTTQRFRKADVAPRHFRFAFDDLGCEAVVAHIPASRARRSVRMMRRFGFKMRGRMSGGGCRMEITRDTCPWLETTP